MRPQKKFTVNVHSPIVFDTAYSRNETTGSHTSDYDAWEINGKAAWDMSWGSVIVSPSLSVFGGNSRNREGLTQTLTHQNVARREGPNAEMGEFPSRHRKCRS